MAWLYSEEEFGIYELINLDFVREITVDSDDIGAFIKVIYNDLSIKEIQKTEDLEGETTCVLNRIIDYIRVGIVNNWEVIEISDDLFPAMLDEIQQETKNIDV